MYDLFICHGWRYHDGWVKLVELLDAAEGLEWRNFSLPWHDPAITPQSKEGSDAVHGWIYGQVTPAQLVILPADVYAIESARQWVDEELHMAKDQGKPIVVVGPEIEVKEISGLEGISDHVVAWGTSELVSKIEELLGNR